MMKNDKARTDYALDKSIYLAPEMLPVDNSNAPEEILLYIITENEQLFILFIYFVLHIIYHK